MIVYWILLLPVAFVAYFLGSMSSITIASRYIFHYNLRRLGSGNVWLSNFRRRFGIPGALGLLFVELVRDIIPILFGALMLSFKGHADVGRAFAGFCLVLGQLYPVMYNFRGGSATVAMVVAAMSVDVSMGIAALGAALVVMLVTRTVTGGTAFGAVIMLSAAVLIVNGTLLTRLCIFTALLVIIRHIPAVIRIINRREPRFSFREDLSYKFDL